MNRLQRWAMKAVGGKALNSPLYPGSGMYGFDWLDAFDLKTPTDDDFAKAVKQAHRSSVVMSCVEFLVENATSTPWQLRDGDGEIVEEHPVLDLLNNPLPEMDGIALMAGWLQSLSLDGNGYAVILPARSGEMGGLQYIPHTAMKVATGSKGEPTGFIYRVDGRDIRLRLDEVIHIRRYADWERIHYGRSPIAALGPEIWIDMEAARMVAAIMKKRGMPGGMIAPKPMQEDNQPLLMSPEDLQANREYMRKEYTGDKRGDWMMFGFPMDAHGIPVRPAHLRHERRSQPRRRAHLCGFRHSCCGRRSGCRSTQHSRRRYSKHIRATGVAGRRYSHAAYHCPSVYAGAAGRRELDARIRPV